MIICVLSKGVNLIEFQHNCDTILCMWLQTLDSSATNRTCTMNYEVHVTTVRSSEVAVVRD